MQLIYKEGPPIFNHVNEFQGLLDQLSNVGVKFDDETLGLWLLNTLLDSWEIFWVSHTNSAPNGVITMDHAKSEILNEEVRRKLKFFQFYPKATNSIPLGTQIPSTFETNIYDLKTSFPI